MCQHYFAQKKDIFYMNKQPSKDRVLFTKLYTWLKSFTQQLVVIAVTNMKCVYEKTKRRIQGTSDMMIKNNIGHSFRCGTARERWGWKSKEWLDKEWCSRPPTFWTTCKPPHLQPCQLLTPSLSCSYFFSWFLTTSWPTLDASNAPASTAPT